MTYLFHPEAEAEFFGAIEYYEACEPGLGQKLAAEVTSAILRILDYPFGWPVLEGEVRRCLTHQFPFGILYTVYQEDIFILAVMHLRREPGYWKPRHS